MLPLYTPFFQLLIMLLLDPSGAVSPISPLWHKDGWPLLTYSLISHPLTYPCPRFSPACSSQGLEDQPGEWWTCRYRRGWRRSWRGHHGCLGPALLILPGIAALMFRQPVTSRVAWICRDVVAPVRPAFLKNVLGEHCFFFHSSLVLQAS